MKELYSKRDCISFQYDDFLICVWNEEFVICLTDLLDFSDTDSVSNNDWWMTDIPDSVPNPELEPQPATWSGTDTAYNLISLDDSHDDVAQDDSIFERYVKVLFFCWVSQKKV